MGFFQTLKNALLKIADRQEVERKARKIFNQGGVNFISVVPNEDIGRATWEFDVNSTSGETYPVYLDTDFADPDESISWDDIICGCFPAGTPVVMADGSMKPIEDIRYGDQVRSHTGAIRKVTNTFQREYTGNLTGISPKGFGETIWATPNHGFYIRGGDGETEWKRMDKIRPDDYVSSAIPYTPSRSITFDMADFSGEAEVGEDYVQPTSITRERFGGEVAAKGTALRTARTFRRRAGNPVWRYIDFDEQIAYLMGLYLGDGHARLRGNSAEVIWFFGAEEIELARTVSFILEDRFGVESSVLPPDHNTNTWRVYCYSRPVVNLFMETCGHSGSSKKLSAEIMEAEPSVLLKIAEGHYDADSGTSANRDLISQLYQIFLMNGISASIRKKEASTQVSPLLKRWADDRGDVSKAGDIYQVCGLWYRDTASDVHRSKVEKKGTNISYRFFENGQQWNLAGELYFKSFDGVVYNFEVEEDHSYQVFDVNAKNCDWSKWNYDRAPEYQHLSDLYCSHAQAVDYWLDENGQREFDRALREEESGQTELQYDSDTKGPRRKRPKDRYISDRAEDEGTTQREQRDQLDQRQDQRDQESRDLFRSDETEQPPLDEEMPEETSEEEVPEEEQVQEEEQPVQPAPPEKLYDDEVLKSRFPEDEDEDEERRESSLRTSNWWGRGNTSFWATMEPYSGLRKNADRTFEVGDVVQWGGDKGEITEIREDDSSDEYYYVDFGADTFGDHIGNWFASNEIKPVNEEDISSPSLIPSAYEDQVEEIQNRVSDTVVPENEDRIHKWHYDRDGRFYLWPINGNDPFGDEGWPHHNHVIDAVRMDSVGRGYYNSSLSGRSGRGEVNISRAPSDKREELLENALDAFPNAVSFYFEDTGTRLTRDQAEEGGINGPFDSANLSLRHLQLLNDHGRLQSPLRPQRVGDDAFLIFPNGNTQAFSYLNYMEDYPGEEFVYSKTGFAAPLLAILFNGRTLEEIDELEPDTFVWDEVDGEERPIRINEPFLHRYLKKKNMVFAYMSNWIFIVTEGSNPNKDQALTLRLILEQSKAKIPQVVFSFGGSEQEYDVDDALEVLRQMQTQRVGGVRTGVLSDNFYNRLSEETMQFVQDVDLEWTPEFSEFPMSDFAKFVYLPDKNFVFWEPLDEDENFVEDGWPFHVQVSQALEYLGYEYDLLVEGIYDANDDIVYLIGDRDLTSEDLQVIGDTFPQIVLYNHEELELDQTLGGYKQAEFTPEYIFVINYEGDYVLRTEGYHYKIAEELPGDDKELWVRGVFSVTGTMIVPMNATVTSTGTINDTQRETIGDVLIEIKDRLLSQGFMEEDFHMMEVDMEFPSEEFSGTYMDAISYFSTGIPVTASFKIW